MRKYVLFIIMIVVVNLVVTNETYGQTESSPPTIKSESAIVIDTKSGNVIYDKNANKKMYPASLTKMATAIYAIENGNLEDIVTVSEKARNTEGSSVYLEEGEQVTLLKLIQGLLINSGNDAAVAIAEHMSGSVEQFSSSLNEYLENNIGLQNTHFKNPHGLFDPDHVTTAADLATITQYALNNKLFKEIFGTIEFEWVGESWDTTLFTHHRLMREIPYEGITGGKTGYVRKSGYTLATTAERENVSVIVITMNSNLKSEMYNDNISLLDYAFNNYQTSSIAEGTVFEVENRKYKTPEKLYYTHTFEEQVKMEVRNDGVLEILNHDDLTIAAYPLEEIKKEVIAAGTKEKQTIQRSSFFENYFIKFSPLLIIIIFGLFLYRRVLNSIN